MKQEALSNYSEIHLIILAFFIFLITFFVITVWTYRKSGKSHYQKLAQLPLEDENHE